METPLLDPFHTLWKFTKNWKKSNDDRVRIWLTFLLMSKVGGGGFLPLFGLFQYYINQKWWIGSFSLSWKSKMMNRKFFSLLNPSLMIFFWKITNQNNCQLRNVVGDWHFKPFFWWGPFLMVATTHFRFIAAFYHFIAVPIRKLGVPTFLSMDLISLFNNLLLMYSLIFFFY